MKTGSHKRAMNLGAFGETLTASDIQPVTTQPNDAQTNALNAIAPNITGAIAQQAYAGERWNQTLARTIPILTATPQQKQLLSIQCERASQSLPPLDPSQYASTLGAAASSWSWKTWAAIAAGFFVLRKI